MHKIVKQSNIKTLGELFDCCSLVCNVSNYKLKKQNKEIEQLKNKYAKNVFYRNKLYPLDNNIFEIMTYLFQKLSIPKNDQVQCCHIVKTFTYSTQNSCVDDLCNTKIIEYYFSKFLLSVLRKNNFVCSIDNVCDFFELVSRDLIYNLIDRCVSNYNFVFKNDHISLDSIENILINYFVKSNSIIDVRSEKFVLGRLFDYTLEDLGLNNDPPITRERVRQIVARWGEDHSHLLQSSIEFEYAKFYTKYNWNLNNISAKDFFSSVFSLSRYSVPFYKNLLFLSNGALDISNALEDLEISQHNRIKIEKQILKNYLIIDGNYVKSSGSDLRKYFSLHCIDKNHTYDINTLFNEFTIFVNHIQGNINLNKAVYRNAFERENYSLKLIKGAHFSFRHYDYDQFDYSILFDAINAFENQNISTQVIINQFPNIQEIYQIKNCEELHNLIRVLKENCKLFENVKMERMPFLVVGNADRKNQVRNVLLDLCIESPNGVTSNSIAERYYQLYGVREQSFKANFLSYLNEYLDHWSNLYKIEQDTLPSSEYIELSKLFSKNYISYFEFLNTYNKYYIDKQIIKAKDPTKYDISKIGYILVGNESNAFLIKNEFKNPLGYVSYLFSQDLVDMSIVSPALKTLSYSYINDVCSKFTFLEYEKNKYIKIDKFLAIGITIDDIYQFLLSVCKYVISNKIRFFSWKKISENFKKEKIFEAGFTNAYFYEMILKRSRKFVTFSILGISIFTSNIEYSDKPIESFLQQYISKNGIYGDSLIIKLYNEYGINIYKTKLKEIIQNNGFYYNLTIDRIFNNVNDYFYYISENNNV